VPYEITTNDPGVVGAAVEKAVSALFITTMTRAWENLITAPSHGGTPVDTGFASASWILSISEPSDEVGGSKENVDLGPSDRGVTALMNYKITYGAVFLVNNTDYIVELNYGSSPQARTGFVERAYEEAIEFGQRQNYL
jgi:hypothetical protein